MSKTKTESIKSTKLTIRKHRIFSEEFKRDKVDKLRSGQLTISQLCKLWQISTTTAYNWLYAYSPQHAKGTTMIVQQDSEAAKTQQLLQQVAHLERTLGQKQMVIDFQDKLIELASSQLQIDLKKTFVPQL